MRGEVFQTSGAHGHILIWNIRIMPDHSPTCGSCSLSLARQFKIHFSHNRTEYRWIWITTFRGNVSDASIASSVSVSRPQQVPMNERHKQHMWICPEKRYTASSVCKQCVESYFGVSQSRISDRATIHDDATDAEEW